MGGKILKIAGGRYTEIADTILDHAWGEGGITHNSAGSINISAGKDIIFANYTPPGVIQEYYRFNPSSYAGGDYSKSLNNRYTTREGWGARPIMEGEGRSFEPYLMVNQNMEQEDKDKEAIPKLNDVFFGIAIHHAGNSGLDSMNKIQNEHIDDKDRADIGYHFGVDLSGKIYEGRYIGVKGSHLTKYNTGVIGIVFIADLDHQWYDFDDSMTRGALSGVITLIKALQEQFPKITTLGGHKEWKNNLERSCPGIMA